MLTEMATALWLVSAVGGEARGAAWAGLALLAVIWLSTAVLQVPAHGRLAGGFHPHHHRFLVRTNWIRTVGWTLRVPVALFLAAVPSVSPGP